MCFSKNLNYSSALCNPDKFIKVATSDIIVYKVLRKGTIFPWRYHSLVRDFIYKKSRKYTTNMELHIRGLELIGEAGFHSFDFLHLPEEPDEVAAEFIIPKGSKYVFSYNQTGIYISDSIIFNRIIKC